MPNKKRELSEITRREFLTISGGSVITISSSKVRAGVLTPQSGGDTAKTGATQKPWYAVMRRCGQINFNEPDPIAMDVNPWPDYWASLRVDPALINGGAIVRFNPIQV